MRRAARATALRLGVAGARRLPPLLLPPPVARALAETLCERERTRAQVVDVLLHHLKARAPTLDELPFDLPVEGELRFEHLAGLFASTALDESIAMMNVRQVAYLFGLIRETRPDKVIEIGRLKGGTTLAIAAAMSGRGQFWSIDAAARTPHYGGRPVTEQVADACGRLGLRATVIDADPATLELDTGEVDLVFIDGDHSYEGCRRDFERWGRRVRVGGAVLLDDAFDDGFFRPRHTLGVEPVVREVQARGDFRLERAVKRLAHLERVA